MGLISSSVKQATQEHWDFAMLSEADLEVPWKCHIQHILQVSRMKVHFGVTPAFTTRHSASQNPQRPGHHPAHPAASEK